MSSRQSFDEQAGGGDVDRTVELDQSINNLASLYAASSQICGTLSVGLVLKHMCELLEQFIGAQSFVIYVASADGTRGVPVGARGQDLTQVPTVSLRDGVIGDACLTGMARVLEPQQGSSSTPIAVLPLGVDSEVVGVVTIHRLFPHKQTWATIDRELFTLLSTQGAVSLIAANLFAKTAGPRAALHDVKLQLENDRLRQLGKSEPELGGDA